MHLRGPETCVILTMQIDSTWKRESASARSLFAWEAF